MLPVAAGHLLQIMSVGSNCTVELLGAPSAATSSRWQVALHLAPSKEEASSSLAGEDREGLLAVGPAAQHERMQEGTHPGESSLHELWGDYDGGLLLDVEDQQAVTETSSRGAPKGPSSGRRRRTFSGIPAEEAQGKRQGSRGGGREGRRLLGSRRSGRERDEEGTDADTNDFLVVGGSHEGDPVLAESVNLSDDGGPLDSTAPLEDPHTEPPATSHAHHPPSRPATATAAGALCAPSKGKVSRQGPPPSSFRAAKSSLSVRLQPRPAVVAVLGHVDHGKTTLLRALRFMGMRSNFLRGRSPARSADARHVHEAGGITQQIGIFGVTMRAPVPYKDRDVDNS